MKWFRLHSEFATDPKLKTFSKCQRYDLVCLMCLANESKDRGVISLDAEDVAATLGLEEAKYAEFLAKLERKGIVSVRDDGAIIFTNWLARQYDKPSDTPQETARRQRDNREKKSTDTPQPVTPKKPKSLNGHGDTALSEYADEPPRFPLERDEQEPESVDMSSFGRIGATVLSRTSLNRTSREKEASA